LQISDRGVQSLRLHLGRLARFSPPCGDEFIASPPRDGLPWACGLAESFADGSQTAVTRFHPSISIDPSQAVQVEHEDCPVKQWMIRDRRRTYGQVGRVGEKRGALGFRSRNRLDGRPIT
jgi:hypothetical protein